VFFRKLTTYLLLAFYGVPAAIGPYWHNHHDSCCEHIFFLDAPQSTGTSHSTGTTANSCSSTQQNCKCDHHHSTSSGSEARASVNRFAQVTFDRQFDGCTICKFYSCTPFVASLVSSELQVCLTQCLVTAERERLQTNLLLHFARGPPAIERDSV